MYGPHETKAYIRLVAPLLPNVLQPLRGVGFIGPGCAYTTQSLCESYHRVRIAAANKSRDTDQQTLELNNQVATIL